MNYDVLIVSDTHGRLTRLDELIEYRQKLLKNGEVLTIIFLGDGLCDLFASKHFDGIITYAVRGNCDASDRFSPYGEEMPLYRTVDLGGHRIFMAHGHTLSVKSTRDELCREASRQGADIALFGHTHVPALEYIEKGSVRGVERDLVIFNPGSLGDFSGRFGNLSLSDGGFLFSHGEYHNITKK